MHETRKHTLKFWRMFERGIVLQIQPRAQRSKSFSCHHGNWIYALFPGSIAQRSLGARWQLLQRWLDCVYPSWVAHL